MSDIVNQFREEELPVSTVDISRAVQDGHRRRRRRVAVLAAAATVVALVAGIVAGSGLLSATPEPAPPAAPTCDRRWEQFDPMISEIDASGVEGYRVAMTGTAPHWQNLGLSNPAGDRGVQLTLYSCGGEPRSIADGSPIDPAAGEPADPVNGVPAYWLPAHEPAVLLALAWQWTPGAWAILAPDGSQVSVSSDEQRAAVVQVAKQLRFGAGTPVTSPFSLPMPEGMRPAVTLTSESTFYFGLDTVSTEVPTTFVDYVPYLWVNGSAFATVNNLPTGATEYLDEDLGYPTYKADQRHEGRDSDILLVYDFFGLGMEIEPRGMTAAAQTERLSYAADIFRTITVYPGAATNPSAWGDPIAP